MMRRLAKVLWRLMPRALREAMALEAPTVLRFHESHYRDTVYRSWLREELDLGTTPTRWDDEGEVPYAFTFDRFADGAEFANQDDAFEALTLRLAEDPAYVLVKEKLVFHAPPFAEPPPKLLPPKPYDSDEVPF